MKWNEHIIEKFNKAKPQFFEKTNTFDKTWQR